VTAAAGGGGSVGGPASVAAAASAVLGPAVAGPASADPLGTLGRRLALCAPLAAAALVLAIGPGTASPGWQWVTLVLAAPVVSWGAWPIHRAAWLGLGRGPATLDTLVSASVSASFAWSLYALLDGGAGAAGPRMLFGQASGQPSGQAVYLAVAAGTTVFALAGRYMGARSHAGSGGPPTVTQQLAAASAGNARHGTRLTVPAATLADRAAPVFVPCVLALAVVTLGFWSGAGLPPASAWSATVAVLVVACPCALGLATPAALLAARARGAELGILVRNAGSLGIATGVGAGSGDLALMSADPGLIADAIQLARVTSSIIRANLAWAFGVNAIAIPLAALGYLSPLAAGIAVAASSVIVVANSLLLRGYRPGRHRR
jgi:cation transport ATPase